MRKVLIVEVMFGSSRKYLVKREEGLSIVWEGMKKNVSNDFEHLDIHVSFVAPTVCRAKSG